jgi:hypothetical protein
MASIPTTTCSRRGPHPKEARRAEAQARYGALMPWWAHSSAEKRRAAIEAKLDSEHGVAPARDVKGRLLPVLSSAD